MAKNSIALKTEAAEQRREKVQKMAEQIGREARKYAAEQDKMDSDSRD